jgi:hypothetical protein
VSRPASVQAARVGLEAIEEGVLRLAGGRCRAVLRVSSIDFGLQGDAERDAVGAGFAAFLNGLTFPLQVLVRVLPVDLEHYLGPLEARARELPDALADLARDHVAFVRALATRRSLLERRFYVVVPADPPHRPARSFLRLLWPFGRGAAPAVDTAAVQRQLVFRCTEVARQLGRCGLTARRLDDAGLAGLVHACWCPELARVQRLRGALGAYTRPVVTAPRPAAERGS